VIISREIVRFFAIIRAKICAGNMVSRRLRAIWGSLLRRSRGVKRQMSALSQRTFGVAEGRTPVEALRVR
jgi:hypothetical protein